MEPQDQESKRGPRKPSLSPTKITTYLSCPLKYRWTYLDFRGKRFLTAKHYYSFGSTLHKVLERFHDAGDAGVQSVSDAVMAVEKEWVSAGFASKEQEADALRAGKEIVEQYVGAHLERPPEVSTLFLERMLRVDLGEFVLIGRVDRVDEHPDGTLEVVDYKSGRTALQPEDVSSDIAMGCYQLLLRKLYPGRRIVATIVALRSGIRATASLTDEEATGFERDLLVLGQEILGTDWNEVLPSVKPACWGCDFIPLCRQHEPFAEELDEQIRELEAETPLDE